MSFDKKKLGLLLLLLPPTVWVIYRVFALDITHDEAWSFRMAYENLYDKMTRTANNHWLNTLFLKIEIMLLGTDIWKIRLHSIGAYFIFIYYLYKIVLRVPNKWLAPLAIVLILYNTYILDFFSLARGYAFGLAFSVAAIYYILYGTTSVKNRLRIYALLVLSCIGVYTHLYFLLAYGIYELLFIFKFNFSKKHLLNFIKPLWLPLLFLAIAVKNLLFIKENGDLNEGLNNGFFPDTLGVFIQRAFEPWFYLHTAVIIGVLLFVLLLLAIFLPAALRTANKSAKLGTLLLIAFGIHYVLFYAMHTPFPFGRTSLYYIVPLLLCICLFLSEVKIPEKFHIAPIVLLGILFSGHLYYATKIKNVHTTQEWWMGQGVSQVVNKIAEIETRNLDSLSILYYEGHNGDYENYYKRTVPNKVIHNSSRIHPQLLEDDFNKIGRNPNTFDYILLPNYDWILKSHIQFDQYDSISFYGDMKTWLLQKKH